MRHLSLLAMLIPGIASGGELSLSLGAHIGEGGVWDTRTKEPGNPLGEISVTYSFQPWELVIRHLSSIPEKDRGLDTIGLIWKAKTKFP